ncbi:MAG: sigma-54-dependent transcriptional regulator [Balneolaceae bacterium]
MKGTVLIADDEQEIRESLSVVLEDDGYETATVGNGEAAVEKLGEIGFDILITDLKMPGKGGIEVLQEAQKLSPGTLCIIITAYASVETAVEALRFGASDYLLKPLEFDEVIHRINHLMERKALAQENKYLREQINRQFNFNFIIGESPAMRRVYKLIEKVSNANTHVLITGRSGTGKELVARAIHEHSDRSEKPFIAINCGAIPESLVESELFGHKKGAFTGATEDKEGVFAAANKGTLFLDEIGEIPLNVQVHLLRVLQDKEVKQVGSNQVKKVDTRIIAATNKNLKEEVKNDRFREDLFYRLNVVEIPLPSLGERREDIPLLVRHFIERYNRELGRSVKGAETDAMHVMMNYDWPGQVRELENAIERAVLLGESDYITADELPSAMREGVPEEIPGDFEGNSLEEAVQHFERSHISSILRHTGGNKAEAARLMGIDPSTLYRKMERLGLNEQDE